MYNLKLDLVFSFFFWDIWPTSDSPMGNLRPDHALTFHSNLLKRWHSLWMHRKWISPNRILLFSNLHLFWNILQPFAALNLVNTFVSYDEMQVERGKRHFLNSTLIQNNKGLEEVYLHMKKLSLIWERLMPRLLGWAFTWLVFGGWAHAEMARGFYFSVGSDQWAYKELAWLCNYTYTNHESFNILL